MDKVAIIKSAVNEVTGIVLRALPDRPKELTDELIATTNRIIETAVDLNDSHIEENRTIRRRLAGHCKETNSLRREVGRLKAKVKSLEEDKDDLSLVLSSQETVSHNVPTEKD